MQRSTWITLLVATIAAMTVNALPAAKLNGYADDHCEPCVCGVRGRGNRIVGGVETAANEYPWMVGISRQGKLACGASLISHNFVMTAAHCVYGAEAKDMRIYLGGHNITRDYTEQRRVRAVHRHELFDIFTYDNDIAILELDRPIQFGPKVQPGCLPDATHAMYDGVSTVVAGWGRIGESKPTSQVLRSLVLPVWSEEQCRESGYGRDRITKNMMCAGYHDGQKDACQGDSGSPMHMEGVTGSMEVIGLVSWGRGCARPNLPGLYTRVVNYLPWIQRKIGNECLCSPKSGARTNYLERHFGNQESQF